MSASVGNQVGNPALAAYARAVADGLPGGSLERLSAGCAQVALDWSRTPARARMILSREIVRLDHVREAALQFLDELLSVVSGITDDMANVVPPIVRSATAGGHAYLLEWHQLPGGEWGAEIAWLEWDGQKWAGRRQKVLAADVTKLDGQDYRGVPQVKAAEMARRANQGRP